MRIAIVGLLALLAGCGLIDPDWQQRADHERCVGLGFQAGSESYGNCRLQVEANREAASVADSARTAKAIELYRLGSNPYGYRY